MASQPKPTYIPVRLSALIAAFIMGLGVFATIFWSLGQPLLVVHSVVGGYMTSFWLQRLLQKQFGWWPEPVQADVLERSSAELRKRRMAYSISGTAIGIAVFGLTGWIMGGDIWILDAVMGGFGGYHLATTFGERFRGIATLNELALVRMRESMSPVDLKPGARVPVTLKTTKR